ncbi:MAG: caspase family protein [Devosiaceae bacterium]|nr:caspase family protein [Devosiaceae bacterium MH13]
MLLVPAVAQAAERHALVVGISTYALASDLRHATSDAQQIGDRLAALGYRLHGGQVHVDVTRDELDRLVRDFAATVPDGAVATVWLGGHGVALDGSTYVLPADDQEITDRAGLSAGAMPVASVVGRLAARRDVHATIFVDACRANPLRPAPQSDNGAAQPVSDLVAPASGSAGSVTLIYSAAPGQIASDGDAEAGISPFAEAVLRALDEPQRPINALFAELALAVRHSGDGHQTPWMTQALAGAVPDFSVLP